jgi:hypothetical protein
MKDRADSRNSAVVVSHTFVRSATRWLIDRGCECKRLSTTTVGDTEESFSKNSAGKSVLGGLLLNPSPIILEVLCARDDLLKPDAMSEAILLGAGAVVLVILILVLVVALTQASAPV